MTTTQHFYCPCCGYEITPKIQQPLMAHLKPMTELTCRRKSCDMWEATTYYETLIRDDKWMNAWKFTARFCIDTGAVLQ